MQPELPEPLRFSAELRLFESPKADYFLITLPRDVGEQIRFFAPAVGRGWGSVPVHVCVGETRWRTSVFPHKESGSYIMLIKKSVRVAEGLGAGDAPEFAVELAA